jgi:hypothetical protein
VGNCSQGFGASVGTSVYADAVTSFNEGFQARGRGFIKVCDSERLMGQRVLIYVLEWVAKLPFVSSCW